MALRPLRGTLLNWSPGRAFLGTPLQAVSAAWPDIVGTEVAAHAAPLRLGGGTLVVATRSSAWNQQLQFLSPAILAGLRALEPPVAVERVTFRTGAFVPARPRRALAAGAARRTGEARGPRGEPPGPATDLTSALGRLRRRVVSLREAAPATCHACAAPLQRPGPALCAPCAGDLETARSLALEQVLYMAPWLGYAALREQFTGLTAAEYDRSRRRLLQRWWGMLERLRRAARPASRLERQVAGSYLLLQSQLPPDRLSPAVVRNLLGADLEMLLWPAAEAFGPPR